MPNINRNDARFVIYTRNRRLGVVRTKSAALALARFHEVEEV